MADSPEVIEAREKKDDREYYANIVETYPTLIEWANDEIRDDKEKVISNDFYLSVCKKGSMIGKTLSIYKLMSMQAGLRYAWKGRKWKKRLE